MNDPWQEREVSRVLHELFPEPPDIALRLPDARPRHRVSRMAAVLGSAAAVVAIIIGVRLVPDLLAPAPGGQPTVSAGTATTSPPAVVPAWARKCLPQKAADRLGPEPEYLSLTYQAAVKLARERGDVLHVVGAGGRCGMPVHTSPDYLPGPVAVVFDQGDSVTGQIPASARVVAAEHVSGSWSGPPYSGG